MVQIDFIKCYGKQACGFREDDDEAHVTISLR